MGEIRVDIQLQNPVNKHKLKLNVLVDTGAVMTLLPQEVVEELGLKIIDRRIVVLANDQKVEMNLAGPFLVTIGKIKMGSDCLVGPPGCEPLVGQLIMEGMDLITDPLRKTITPRPESPFLPTLKLK